MTKLLTTKQMAAEASRLNGKKGGRPKGSRSPAVIARNKEIAEKKLEIDEVRKAFQASVMRMMPALTQAQAALAKGLTFLYVIKTDRKGNRGKPQLITDLNTIEAYLANELENDDHEYYFMATEKPNNGALDSMLDRTMGRAVQPLSTPDGGKIEVHITQYGAPKP